MMYLFSEVLRCSPILPANGSSWGRRAFHPRVTPLWGDGLAAQTVYKDRGSE